MRKRFNFRRKLKESKPYKRSRRINEGWESSDTPKIFVSTYALYNNGMIEGDWEELTDYSSKDEFLKAMEAKMDKIQRENLDIAEDVELMFQDWENCGDLVSESSVDEKLFELIQAYDDYDYDYDVDWEDYIQLAADHDMEDMWLHGDSDEDLGYAYIESIGDISELGKDTLERYFDYEQFGRDLRMESSYEEIDGTYYLFD